MLLAEVVAGVSVLANAALAVLLDRQRAQRRRERFVLDAFLAKARADRRDMVRIPADQLAAMFKLDGRTLRPSRSSRRGKGGPHPATLKPARRRKLGANA